MIKQNSMQEGWIKVYDSGEEYQAVLIKELLERHGLHPVLMDRRDDEFMIGDAQVFVSVEEQQEALRVIEENQKSS